MTVSRPPEPTELRSNETPAIVDVSDQGQVFVAMATDKDSGWLRVRYWDGKSAKLPPHRVMAVEYLETERYGEPDDRGLKSRRIADESWRQRAKEINRPDDEQLVTDGGTRQWGQPVREDSPGWLLVISLLAIIASILGLWLTLAAMGGSI